MIKVGGTIKLFAVIALILVSVPCFADISDYGITMKTGASISTGDGSAIASAKRSAAFIFVSSDTAPGVTIGESTVTFRVPSAWTFTAAHIFNNDASGSCSVAISTGDTIAGTFVVISSGSAMATTTEYHSLDLKGWVGSKTIPAGKIIKLFTVGTPATTQSITFQLDYTN